jgi:hypothetical protein
MSNPPGWQRPADEDPEPETPPGDSVSTPPADSGSAPPEPPAPLYPGWSTQQPPAPGWQAPGQSPGQAGSGWTSPQPGGPASAPPPGGYPQPGQSVPPPGAPGGGASYPGAPHPGAPYPGAPQQAGWGTGATWGWAQAVKPGVIPLRPLGIGEILDGAVTTIRRNPGPMLGLSAVVAVIVQLAGMLFTLSVFRDLGRLEELPADATAGEVFDAFSGIFSGSLVIAALDWVGTVILTGILTVVVSRAVLGQRLTASEAWHRARPRLRGLLGLTALYTLIWLSPGLITAALVFMLAVAGAGEVAAVVGVLLGIASVPLAVWLYVRYALAAPALMLETTHVGVTPHHNVTSVGGTSAGGNTRPIGVIAALQRSAELVRRSWWRVFGILLLVVIIANIVTQVLSLPFSIPLLLSDPIGEVSFPAVAATTLGAIVATTITAPFVAGAVALLYVDRRIRAEALDIELARAAGVSLPGRTPPQPPAPPGPGAP